MRSNLQILIIISVFFITLISVPAMASDETPMGKKSGGITLRCIIDSEEFELWDPINLRVEIEADKTLGDFRPNLEKFSLSARSVDGELRRGAMFGKADLRQIKKIRETAAGTVWQIWFNQRKARDICEYFCPCYPVSALTYMGPDAMAAMEKRYLTLKEPKQKEKLAKAISCFGVDSIETLQRLRDRTKDRERAPIEFWLEALLKHQEKTSVK